MIRLEFHCHTIYSKDSLATPERLLETCRAKGIDRLVITDHNTIAGALRARELDPARVIVGEEIMTTQGELLAAFVQECVPPGLPPLEAIARLREQSAFISVSHPFDFLRQGYWSEPALLEITSLVDAIETFNARCYRASFNEEALAFAKQHDLPGTVGSDAHALFEVGRASMTLPDFDDTASLKAALKMARYTVSLSSPWVHLTSRYAVWRKKLGRT